MKIVRPYSGFGKLLCSLIYVLCLPLYVLKGKAWKYPRAFEENPRYMSFKDILYFAYKYYFKSSDLPGSERVHQHFKPLGQPDQYTKLATLSIGGDLMPYAMLTAQNTQNLWQSVGPDFFASDVVFANLETPLVSQLPPAFVPEVMLNDMHFNANEDMMRVFSGNAQFKGYDVLSVCNNHSLDQGVEGLDQTLSYLEANKIKAVGARKEELDQAFTIIECNGIKIGFVAFTFSLNQFERPMDKPWKVNALRLNTYNCDIQEIVNEVDLCRAAGAEFIICSLHCGNAYQAYPSEQTVDLFERVFEATGVDIIAGSHPHNLQPWTFYEYTSKQTGQVKKGFAIYSLADFVAYDIYTWCHLCAYLKIELYKDEAGQLQFWPIVKPLIMQNQNNALQLQYADVILQQAPLSAEAKDIKVLYDICMQPFKPRS